MDQGKLVGLIRQYSLIWDKKHPQHRDKHAKDRAWIDIARQMRCTDKPCQKSYKSLREKYLRERDKTTQTGGWELIPELKFLDPHILTLKQPQSSNETFDFQNDSDIYHEGCEKSNIHQNEQDKLLIEFVKKNFVLWKKNDGFYPNKTLKQQLWHNISQKLNIDVNSCTSRWKSLREKYIRQKAKYLLDGEKWELLDELTFLDNVIQYRKKFEFDTSSESAPTIDEILNIEDTNIKQNNSYQHQENNSNMTDVVDDSIINDSSSDYQMNIKQEINIPDTTNCSWNDTTNQSTTSRKRLVSTSSNEALCISPVQKKAAVEETADNTAHNRKDPEELFGELVTAMLRAKPENQRKACMVEIMTVLSR